MTPLHPDVLESRIALEVARLRVLAAETAIEFHRIGRFALIILDKPNEIEPAKPRRSE